MFELPLHVKMSPGIKKVDFYLIRIKFKQGLMVLKYEICLKYFIYSSCKTCDCK